MAAPKLVTYFKVSIEDRPGTALDFTKTLKEKNLGLTALWGYGTQPGQAEVCCIPKNPDKFRAFAEASGMNAREATGILLKGADRTGALVKTFEAIAKAGVNITSGIAIAAGGNYGAFLEFGGSEIQKAAKAVGAK